jgi:hypothetical protein
MRINITSSKLRFSEYHPTCLFERAPAGAEKDGGGQKVVHFMQDATVGTLESLEA